MKILILGSGGLLGSSLKKVFFDLDVVAWGKKECDITKTEKAVEKIKRLSPNFIINASGYTKVDAAEQNQAEAFLINAEAVLALAKTANQIDAVIIHYSTDYVFSGNKNEDYTEEDAPDFQLNVYGQSKALGEKYIRQNAKKYYLIRTQWLFGEYGRDFIDAMISLLDKKEIYAKNDEYGTPTYASDIARATRRLIEDQPLFGIYHFIGSGAPISIKEYAALIFNLYKKECRHAPKIIPISSEEYFKENGGAKRPERVILKNTKLKPLPAWEESVKKHIEELSQNKC